MTATKTKARKTAKTKAKKTAKTKAKTKTTAKNKTTAKKTAKKQAEKPEAVHPKISERRSGVAKDRSRRRSQTVFTLGFISMLAVIALAVLESPLFNVGEVNAAGNLRVTSEQIVTASGVVLGSQLSDVDTEGAEQAVMASSPWIKSVQVERSWNGVVTVYVVERSPVLAAPSRAEPGALMLVDETGRQIESVTEVPSGVLAVEGVSVSGRPGQPSGVEILRAAAVVEGLTKPVRDMTRQVDIVDGLVQLIIDDQARIIVGDQTLLDDKMIAVETLFARVDMRCLHQIDVRVPAAPTVTRQTNDGQSRAIVDDLSQCV